MSGRNTSATGGYLIDVPPPNPEGDALQAGLQAMAAALSGLPGTLVRPRWQAMPPVQPDLLATWASIGTLLTEADEFPVMKHVWDATLPGQTAPGYTILQRHSTLTVLVTFYGPEADEAAKRLRDGLYIPQNYEPLMPLGLKLRTVHDLARAPEVMNQQYVDRIDLRIEFRMLEERVYPIFNLDGADVNITDGRITAQASVRGASPASATPAGRGRSGLFAR